VPAPVLALAAVLALALAAVLAPEQVPDSEQPVGLVVR